MATETISGGHWKQLSIGYEEALARLPDALKKEGFGIITQIDMQETFKAKSASTFGATGSSGVQSVLRARRVAEGPSRRRAPALQRRALREGRRQGGRRRVDPMQTLGASGEAGGLADVAREVGARLERSSRTCLHEPRRGRTNARAAGSHGKESAMSTIAMTADTFPSQIQKGIVFIDFWAAGVAVPRVRADLRGGRQEAPTFTWAKVDTEAEQDLAGALEIRSIPTLMVFRDGVLLFAQPGLLPPRDRRARHEGARPGHERSAPEGRPGQGGVSRRARARLGRRVVMSTSESWAAMSVAPGAGSLRSARPGRRSRDRVRLTPAPPPARGTAQTGMPTARSARPRFEHAEQWAPRFDDPSRDAWQKPKDVVEAMEIQRDDGGRRRRRDRYFEPWLSRAVGESGTVLALDVERTWCAT